MVHPSRRLGDDLLCSALLFTGRRLFGGFLGLFRGLPGFHGLLGFEHLNQRFMRVRLRQSEMVQRGKSFEFRLGDFVEVVILETPRRRAGCLRAGCKRDLSGAFRLDVRDAPAILLLLHRQRRSALEVRHAFSSSALFLRGGFVPTSEDETQQIQTQSSSSAISSWTVTSRSRRRFH